MYKTFGGPTNQNNQEWLDSPDYESFIYKLLAEAPGVARGKKFEKKC